VKQMDKNEGILTQLGAGKFWDKRSDGWWSEASSMDVEKMARLMTAAGARLVTITAAETSKGEFRIIYHWDLEGRMLNLVTMTVKGTICSIAAIHPASDWMEREIHDCFAVQFNGRDSAPLLLSPEDPPGIFLHQSRDDQEGKERAR